MACFAKTVLPTFKPPSLQLFSNGGDFETKLHPNYTPMQLQQANTDSVNKQLNLFTKKNSKITHITNGDLFNDEHRRAFSKDMMRCTDFQNTAL